MSGTLALHKPVSFLHWLPTRKLFLFYIYISSFFDKKLTWPYPLFCIISALTIIIFLFRSYTLFWNSKHIWQVWQCSQSTRFITHIWYTYSFITVFYVIIYEVWLCWEWNELKLYFSTDSVNLVYNMMLQRIAKSSVSETVLSTRRTDCPVGWRSRTESFHDSMYWKNPDSLWIKAVEQDFQCANCNFMFSL